MKFITEDDLRDVYKKEPFTSYDLEPETRLTPGARQFLADRGINMFDDVPLIKKTEGNQLKKSPLLDKKTNWRKKKLESRMKVVEAMFLLTEEELLKKDVCLAQSLILLGKQFSCINGAVAGNGAIESLGCQECTGITADNFSEDIGDCFEINEFHMQLEKGREILLLHTLRCELREIEPIVLELYERNQNSEEENRLYEEVIEKVNQVINTLSQMICTAFGGKKCQRLG